ncbi:MAG: ribosome biogenesis GTPase YlqF [Clostridia bacterium]|nr:ribosome biogenesis GTPase YlqF [Clostridia bacterium]
MEGNPINWYPGHMAKAKRMLEENLKLIDVVIELVDARAPTASRNPDFDALFQGKSRVLLLNKSDLADPATNKRWIGYYKRQGIEAAEVTASAQNAKTTAIRLIEKATAERVKRFEEKGVKKTIRVLIAGIPNVGKSTLINRIAGEKRAQTGDKPGVTKGKQWVKITPHLELLDSPGLLWPKLGDVKLSEHLAFLGSINDEILNIEELAEHLLATLRELKPDALFERYKKLSADTPEGALLEGVAKSRGFVLKGGVYDTERAARIVLDEFRAGKIARVSLEQPPKEEDDGEAE